MDRLPFEVLAFGRFPPGRVRVDFDAAPRASTPEIDRLIDAEWRERTAQASRAGQHLFNGELFRYISHACDGAEFALTVGPTCYRDFVGTNLFNHHRVHELGWHRFANPLGTTATLLTGDGFVVFGRRSHRVAYHGGYVHTIGGTLEVVDRRADGVIDVFDSVRRELQEELGFSADQLRDLACVGLIRDLEILQPELLFEATLDATLADILTRFDLAVARNEHAGLVAIQAEPSLWSPYFNTEPHIAPVAVGAMFLFGRARWGDAWYGRTSASFPAA
ncbi:MAG: hypothetical protein L6Q92_14475 [Phycisphaerae bacterium]|nr:hypothetical protein [Phycisphaerae bacterium]